MARSRPHLPSLTPCPHLPPVAAPLTHESMAGLRTDRGEVFYETALAYASSLWLQGLPARCLLLINRAFSADLQGDEPILERYPWPYAAVAWVLRHRPQPEDRYFIGNPRRHYQHLATRMVPPRLEQRRWRAWACWYLAKQILPPDAFPADAKQIADKGVVEPSQGLIAERLDQYGLPGECSLWAQCSRVTEADCLGRQGHQ